MDKHFILELLKREMIPAMGCTEPAASALAGAKAAELLEGDTVKSVNVYASRNMIKNAMGVGIPHCDKKGILSAVALGIAKRDTSESLNILSDVNLELVHSANLIKDISLNLVQNVPELYVSVEIKGKEHSSVATIAFKHDEFVFLKKDSCILLDKNTCNSIMEDNEDSQENLSKLSVNEILDFAKSVDITNLKFIKRAIEQNLEIARHAIKNSYGLQVGKTLIGNLSENKISTLDDAFLVGSCMAAAGSDARMSGCTMPVVINSGSGNQGLTVTVPLYVLGSFLKKSEDEIIRSICVSELVGLVLTERKNRLSALCGAFTASIGTACGYAFLLGGDLKTIDFTIRTMLGNVTGIICDGAKSTCALKIYSCLQAAAMSIKLAFNGLAPDSDCGIVGDNISECLYNIEKLTSDGMKETDKTILSIMVNKA